MVALGHVCKHSGKLLIITTEGSRPFDTILSTTEHKACPFRGWTEDRKQQQYPSCRESRDLKEVVRHKNGQIFQRRDCIDLFYQGRGGNTRRRARRCLTPWPRMTSSSWRRTLAMMSRRSRSGTGQFLTHTCPQPVIWGHQLSSDSTRLGVDRVKPRNWGWIDLASGLRGSDHRPGIDNRHLIHDRLRHFYHMFMGLTII